MTILEKMNLLTETEATKRQIIDWAYENRIHVMEIALFEPFEELEKSVNAFYESDDFLENISDEFKKWDKFLDFIYVK